MFKDDDLSGVQGGIPTYTKKKIRVSQPTDVLVRLTGPTRCSGRAEVYYNNVWGTVCDDGWDMKEAAVVCRQLGCGSALSAPIGAHFGQGTGQIWLDDMGCSGSEVSLSECSNPGFGTHSCGHGEDASVTCGKKTYVKKQYLKHTYIRPKHM